MDQTDQQDTIEGADDEDDGILLELDDLGQNLSDFYTLRKTSSAEADEILNNMGASTEVDRRIILQLGAPKPLWLPNRFPSAHALAIRSLEVLDRNGTSSIPVPKMSFLTPIAQYLVGIVTKFIVRSHIRGAADSMFHLYARREANSLVGTEDRRILANARRDMERVQSGFKRNPLGIPGFLLGGAFLSTIIGWIQQSVGLFGSSRLFQLIVVCLLILIAAIASWVIVRGAAVAHRRIELTTERPLKALWETIGRAGGPPGNDAKKFALIAVIITILAVILIPLAIALLVF